jgi:serine O-acetyltransferase
VGAPRRPARPARAAVASVVAGLRAALFPRHFGAHDLSDDGVDYFVGHALDVNLRALVEQVRRGLRHESGGGDEARHAADAAAIVGDFARALPGVRELLERDLRAAFAGDPAAYDLDEVLLCYPGVTAVTHHRLAHALFGLGATLVARSIAEIAHADTGIDIHPGASIGGSFFIDHGTGVVVGETTVIGERVRLYQGVTLGARSFPTDAQGQIIKGAPRHPIVEDDVVIYAGATVLGRVTIGRGSSIGGNVWLTRSVPPGSRITQAQARNESFDEGAGI